MKVIRTIFFTESFQTLFLTVQAEICLRLLKNKEESRILQKSPGRIWRWDPIAENFVPLEALKSNNRLVCSVDFVNDLAMKSITVVADNVSYLRKQFFELIKWKWKKEVIYRLALSFSDESVHHNKCKSEPSNRIHRGRLDDFGRNLKIHVRI